MAQLVQAVAPAAEYLPATQLAHADPDTYVPAEQLEVDDVEHDDAPALEVVSVAQLKHADDPELTEYIPATQVMHEVAAIVTEEVPAAQPEQEVALDAE
jgi:hypothetical protein